MTRRAFAIITTTGGLLVLLSPIAGAASVPVSPGGPAGGLAKDTCPAFSWSVGDRGGPYELVVYPVTADGELGSEPALAVRLPAGAQSWTPSADRCLQAGSRYAWTLRETGSGGEGDWSVPALFRVSAAPSIQEVEAAMETLRRHMAERQVDGDSPDPAAGVLGPLAVARDRRAGGGEEGAVTAGTSSEAMIVLEGAEAPAHIALADAPVLGSPSLTVSSDIALGAASNLFKEGAVFLWDDTSNTALGRNALASATGTATNNTAVGRGALQFTTEGTDQGYGSNNTAVGLSALFSNTTGYGNTASGAAALILNSTGYRNTANGVFALVNNTTGSRNTASGNRALLSNTTGSANTASGYLAMHSNTVGANNTACGSSALRSNTTGFRNTAVGILAGFYATTGDDNIFLGSGAHGLADDANTIRIGGGTGTGAREQNRTFVAGIRGITTGVGDAIPVLIDSAGQLGTTSSSRAVKQEIQEIGELSERLLELRPVAFRYKVNAEANPQTPLQFGLIAEEVAEIFPELVVFDEDGDPETVKYHLLAALLINELQREDREVERAHREIIVLRERLTTLEGVETSGERRDPWWRRFHRRADTGRSSTEE